MPSPRNCRVFPLRPQATSFSRALTLRPRPNQRVVLETPHFTSVPDIIDQTDLIVTVPSRVAELFAVTHGLRSLPLPIAGPSFVVRMHWHGRSHADQGHSWMRDVVTRLLSSL